MRLNDLRRGLAILEVYGVQDVSVGREREIFAGPEIDADENPVVVDEDVEALERLGWDFDEEIGRWYLS